LMGVCRVYNNSLKTFLMKLISELFQSNLNHTEKLIYKKKCRTTHITKKFNIFVFEIAMSKAVGHKKSKVTTYPAAR